MSDSTTPVLGLTKPGVGASEDTWGNKLNTDSDTIDAFAGSTNSQIAALTARIAALESAAPAEAIGTVKWWPSDTSWPYGSWAVCDGALFPVSQYPILCGILGNAWGGDGTTNFAIPDLRGRITAGADFGTDGSEGQYPDRVGAHGGAAGVVLTPAQAPAHAHGGGTDFEGVHTHNVVTYGVQSPGQWIAGGSSIQLTAVNSGTDAQGGHEHTIATDTQGGNVPHPNCQPACVGVFIIRLAMP